MTGVQTCALPIFDDLLTEARKYRLGCVLAHQYLDQCSHSLRASLSANTSIKLAAGVSTGDARTLEPDLRNTAAFNIGQPTGPHSAYLRHVTGEADSEIRSVAWGDRVGTLWQVR